MLPSFAFVPEQEVVDCFNNIMKDLRQHLNVAKYFDDTYIRKRLPDHSRRVPQFSIRIWNIYERVQRELTHTNNDVEGWHKAFHISIVCPHTTISKLLNVIKKEQSL